MGSMKKFKYKPVRSVEIDGEVYISRTDLVRELKRMERALPSDSISKQVTGALIGGISAYQYKKPHKS